jgi:hypothetical protein
MDVGSWLRGLGLERYEAAFRENEIDETVLPTLTADDLKDLGVGVVGHRRKLLNAIAALRGDANTKVPVMKRNGQLIGVDFARLARLGEEARDRLYSNANVKNVRL